MASMKQTPQQVWEHYRQLPDQDMYDYAPLLRSLARGNILEIGVCAGVSTAALLLGLDDKNNGHLWSVDVVNCDVFDHPRWTFLCRDSQKIALSGHFDLLLVDGDHSYAAALGDLNRFSPLVRKGGLVMMHDVSPSPQWIDRILRENWYPVEECRQAWNDFVAARNWPHYIVPGQTGLGVAIVQ